MAEITEDLLVREKNVRSFIEVYSDLFDLDPNLVRGLITQECRFVAEAVSPTGAYGYGQFTGIGAKQVQNIAQMTEKAADLINFTKTEASDPDKGIKAICATLWWLFNRKYHQVTDKKVQLEAVLTFYNAGGRAAALVVKYCGHTEALPYIKELPRNIQSQAQKYAPEVAAWFVAWHRHMQKEMEAKATMPAVEQVNPFDAAVPAADPLHEALIKTLLLYAARTPTVDSIVNVREGLTELTLIFPGELDS